MVSRPWSFFKCCRLLNNGVRQYVGVNAGWCSRHTLHHTDHIHNCTQRIVSSLHAFLRTSIPIKGNLLSNASSMVKFIDG